MACWLSRHLQGRDLDALDDLAAWGARHDPIAAVAGYRTYLLAICGHEEEAGHPWGTREFFLRADDLDAVQAELALGRTVRRFATGGDDNELGTVDPMGTRFVSIVAIRRSDGRLWRGHTACDTNRMQGPGS